jgi:penicillin-binding protein 2
MVDSIEGGDQFSLLSRFSEQHNTSNISDSLFEVVHEAMQGVVDRGTGLGAKVEGINICGKTGTVENYIGSVKQPNHTFFCGFAPRENPKIAIMCVVENSGKFGGTYAAPIVGLMIEKYLKDSITNAGRLDQVEKLATLNLLPARIYKEIRKQDSLRRISESSNLISNSSSKKVSDTNWLEEGDERKGINKFKKDSNLNKQNRSKKDSYPYSFKRYIEGILPDEKRKSIVEVTVKN